jgi:hypothetical protein
VKGTYGQQLTRELLTGTMNKKIFLDYTDETGLLKQGTYVSDIVEDNQKTFGSLL